MFSKRRVKRNATLSQIHRTGFYIMQSLSKLTKKTTADNSLKLFLLFFIENEARYSCVSADDSHEMPRPVFSEKEVIRILFAAI